LRFRVREGAAFRFYGENEGAAYTAGQEVVLSEREAASLLRGKGRRGFDLLEVIDDAPVRRKKPPG
jgi:hypothetical protein